MAIKVFYPVFFWWLMLGSFEVMGQHDTMPAPKALTENDEAIIRWVSDLYEHGIQVNGDTLIMSVEVQRMLADDSLRSVLFPETYTWELALSFMQVMELKKAFWVYINLYPQHKELVMKTVLAYDELFEMDRALLAAFYTFSMMDPQVCDLSSGKPVITRPDIVETKLASVQEMIGYIISYRAQQGK